MTPGKKETFVVKIYEPALKQAGIDETTWHTLRHAFASRAVIAGVDIRTVQELMGHSTITMDHTVCEHPSRPLAKRGQQGQS